MVKSLKELIEEIKPAVINMFRVNMGLKDGEGALVLTDYPHGEFWRNLVPGELEDAVARTLLARAVYEVSKEAFPNNRFEFHAYPMTGRNGAEPPPEVADLMKRFEVVVAITTYSLSHTRAREEACKAGARIASMPGFTAEMFAPGGPMAADYGKIKEVSEKIAAWLNGKRDVKIITDYGTDLRLSVEGRVWDVDVGLYVKPGEWGNLPAGEVYVAPLEGSAEGVLVVPKGWYPGLTEDMTLHISKGLVTKIEGGGRVGDHFRELLGLQPPAEGKEYLARRNVAELGIGTNPNAKRPDNVLEAEKIMGTIHVAIGDNSHFGGKVEADLHEDFLQPEPTVIVDGEEFMVKGKIVILE